MRRYLPKSFKLYPTTRTIIDGTEIFAERATSIKTKAQTWPNHKHYNTWKALFGISLKGIVTFVLPLWTSRVSEKNWQNAQACLEN